MSERPTRRAYLASIGALGCLSGCSADGLGTTDAGRRDGPDTTGSGGETADTTGTAAETDGDRPGAGTAGTDSADGSEPAFVRWAPTEFEGSGAALAHLTVSEFLAAEASFDSENAERIASATGLAYAEEFGLERADVAEVFGIAGEGAVFEGSFAADEVSVASFVDDGRDLSRSAYRGYEIWTAELLGVAVRDGTLVVTDEERETVEALIDSSEEPDRRLAGQSGYPGPIDAEEPPSMGLIDPSGDAPVDAVADSVEIRTRSWEFADGETTLTEVLRFSEEGAVDRDAVESGLSQVDGYGQYDDLSVERDGRNVRISGTVANGEFTAFEVTVETPEPTTPRPSTRLQVTNAYGDVADEAVSVVHLTVTKYPGSGDVDLEAAEVQFSGPDGSQSMRHAGTVDDADANAVFETTEIKDESGALPLVDDPADRAELTIPLEQSGASNLEPFEPGSSRTVRLTTGTGGSTEDALDVPNALAQQDYVNL